VRTRKNGMLPFSEQNGGTTEPAAPAVVVCLNGPVGVPFAQSQSVTKRCPLREGGRYENTSDTRRKNDFSGSSSDGVG
jgi:hypothetical protein